MTTPIRVGILLAVLAIPCLPGTAEDGKADICCRVTVRIERGNVVGSTVAVSRQDGVKIRTFQTAPIQVLRRSGDGRLLAMMHDGSVEEFDLFGKRLWCLPESPVKKEDGTIIGADPLPEGRILLTVMMRQRARNGFRAVEVDQEGRVLRSLDLGPDFWWVRSAEEGRLLVCPGRGPPFEIGWDGKDRSAIGAFINLDKRCQCFDVLALPDGHFVMRHSPDSITEVDRDGDVVWSAGKVVWSFEKTVAEQTHLLANGNILVGMG